MNQNNIQYLVGNNMVDYTCANPIEAFNDNVINFLSDLSKKLLRNERVKQFSDIVTFAFYIRKSNLLKLNEKYNKGHKEIIKLGRGIVFHIAPSNVPINFAYSLVVSLLCGNINIVKVSSKQFEQVDIICDEINELLKVYSNLKNYIAIIKYNNDKEVNDYFSNLCDIRVVWGGDETISRIRESTIKPRTREITFADRYSLLVIDSKYYSSMDSNEKQEIANSFYNDTYLTDQNACTSPRLICFLNGVSEEFYCYANEVIKNKYNYQEIVGSNKLLDASLFSIRYSNLHPQLIKYNNENYIYRIKIDRIDKSIVDFKGKAGLFVEYDMKNMLELQELCNNEKVQTISYVGEKNIFDELLKFRLKGIDRIVPIGKTMNFDFMWDGYNLFEMMTRNVVVDVH